jgi:hypothetical protein
MVHEALFMLSLWGTYNICLLQGLVCYDLQPLVLENVHYLI